jgi:hypothetical protein
MVNSMIQPQRRGFIEIKEWILIHSIWSLEPSEFERNP